MFCPNCRGEVPDDAKFYPGTVTLKQDNARQHPVNTEHGRENSMFDSKLILEVHPSWWHYFGWFVFSPLFAFLPIIFIILAYGSNTFRICGDRIIVRKGIFSKLTKKISISDIRTVTANQTCVQRILRIGHLHIATARTTFYEINFKDTLQPYNIREIIFRQIRKVRA